MSPRTTSHLGGIVFGLALACFAAYQQFKLPVMLPILLERYGYDRTLAGGFMSVYALVGLFLSLPLGRLIARRGPLGPVQAALALFAAAAVLPLAYPQSGLLVLLSRGLEGTAFAVLAIAGPVLANASAAPRQLPVVAGFAAAWIPVGQLSATLLAPLAVWFGWQLLWIVAIAGTFGFWLWARLLARLEALPAARPAAGGRSQGHSSEDDKLTPHQSLGLVLTGLIFMLWSGQYFAYMTWLPQYLVEVHGLQYGGAVTGYLVPVFLVMLFCILTGMMLRAGASLRWLLIGALVSQVVVWALVPWSGAGLGGLVSLVVYGIGAGIVPACFFAMPSALLRGGHNTARAFAIVMTGRNIGVLAGPILLAQAFEWAGSWDWAAPIFTAVTALTLPPALALARRLGPA